MDFRKQFEEYIKIHQLFTKQDHLLLAVSGGVDSVVLCDLCYKAGFHFTIAHCNFQLRGQESERDENFVKALGEKYKVEVEVKKFDTKKFAIANKLSTQEAARKLRYDWFAELVNGQWSIVNIKAHNSRLTTNLLTAHHADDNIETVVMNFFRGTGITGLRGMLSKQNNIIRPLLFARREEIELYAKENQLDYVSDSSNLSDDYTRNFFRNKILPLINEVYPQASQNILHNIGRFTETEMLYQQAIDHHKQKLLEQKGNEIHIPILKLKKSQPQITVLYEIIKEYGFTPQQVMDVKKLMDAENGKYVASATHRIIRNRNWLIIAPNTSTEAQHILIDEGDKEIIFPNGKINIEIKEHSAISIEPSPSTAQLDAKEISFPLLLRRWKAGDYFYPLGMKKKKKLSRFFIDQKLSKTEKENMWVIESNKKIVWVVGQRIDDRFKLTDATKNVIVISVLYS